MGKPVGGGLGQLVFARQWEGREEYPAHLVLNDPDEADNKANGMVLIQWADRKDRELVPVDGVRTLDDDSRGRRGRRRNAVAAPAPKPARTKKKAPAKTKKTATKHAAPKSKPQSKGKAKGKGKTETKKKPTVTQQKGRKQVALADLSDSSDEEEEIDETKTEPAASSNKKSDKKVASRARGAQKENPKVGENGNKRTTARKEEKVIEAVDISGKSKAPKKEKKTPTNKKTDLEVIVVDDKADSEKPSAAKAKPTSPSAAADKLSAEAKKPTKKDSPTEGAKKPTKKDSSTEVAKEPTKKDSPTEEAKPPSSPPGSTGAEAAPASPQGSPQASPWTCPMCTFLNQSHTGSNAKCEMCQNQRPANSLPPISIDDEQPKRQSTGPAKTKTPSESKPVSKTEEKSNIVAKAAPKPIGTKLPVKPPSKIPSPGQDSTSQKPIQESRKTTSNLQPSRKPKIVARKLSKKKMILQMALQAQAATLQSKPAKSKSSSKGSPEKAAARKVAKSNNNSAASTDTKEKQPKRSLSSQISSATATPKPGTPKIQETTAQKASGPRVKELVQRSNAEKAPPITKQTNTVPSPQKQASVAADTQPAPTTMASKGPIANASSTKLQPKPQSASISPPGPARPQPISQNLSPKQLEEPAEGSLPVQEVKKSQSQPPAELKKMSNGEAKQQATKKSQPQAPLAAGGAQSTVASASTKVVSSEASISQQQSKNKSGMDANPKTPSNTVHPPQKNAAAAIANSAEPAPNESQAITAAMSAKPVSATIEQQGKTAQFGPSKIAHVHNGDANSAEAAPKKPQAVTAATSVKPVNATVEQKRKTALTVSDKSAHLHTGDANPLAPAPKNPPAVAAAVSAKPVRVELQRKTALAESEKGAHAHNGKEQPRSTTDTLLRKAASATATQAPITAKIKTTAASQPSPKLPVSTPNGNKLAVQSSSTEGGAKKVTVQSEKVSMISQKCASPTPKPGIQLSAQEKGQKQPGAAAADLTTKQPAGASRFGPRSKAKTTPQSVLATTPPLAAGASRFGPGSKALATPQSAIVTTPALSAGASRFGSGSNAKATPQNTATTPAHPPTVVPAASKPSTSGSIRAMQQGRSSQIALAEVQPNSARPPPGKLREGMEVSKPKASKPAAQTTQTATPTAAAAATASMPSRALEASKASQSVPLAGTASLSRSQGSAFEAPKTGLSFVQKSSSTGTKKQLSSQVPVQSPRTSKDTQTSTSNDAAQPTPPLRPEGVVHKATGIAPEQKKVDTRKDRAKQNGSNVRAPASIVANQVSQRPSEEHWHGHANGSTTKPIIVVGGPENQENDVSELDVSSEQVKTERLQPTQRPLTDELKKKASSEGKTVIELTTDEEDSEDDTAEQPIDPSQANVEIIAKGVTVSKYQGIEKNRAAESNGKANQSVDNEPTSRKNEAAKLPTKKAPCVELTATAANIAAASPRPAIVMKPPSEDTLKGAGVVQRGEEALAKTTEGQKVLVGKSQNAKGNNSFIQSGSKNDKIDGKKIGAKASSTMTSNLQQPVSSANTETAVSDLTVTEKQSANFKTAPDNKPIEVCLTDSSSDESDADPTVTSNSNADPSKALSAKAAPKMYMITGNKKRSRPEDSLVEEDGQPSTKIRKLACTTVHNSVPESSVAATNETGEKDTGTSSNQARSNEAEEGRNLMSDAVRIAAEELTATRAEQGGKASSTGAIAEMKPALSALATISSSPAKSNFKAIHDTADMPDDDWSLASLADVPINGGQKRKRQLEETKSDEQQDKVYYYTKEFFESSPKESTTALQIVDRVEAKVGASFPIAKKKQLVAYLRELATEWKKRKTNREAPL